MQHAITKTLPSVSLLSDKTTLTARFPCAVMRRRLPVYGWTVAKSQLRPGLTLVATPIGNAADITLRALDALRDADAIVCEDTRMTRRLMDMHGVALGSRPMIAYHDHNSKAAMPRIMGLLQQGARVVFASDAGTPIVADPGYRLAQTVIAEGIALSATPGPCAAIMALTLSGLPSDRFTFAGFPPSKHEARKTFLSAFAVVPSTLIFYESPRRLAASLRDMHTVFGDRDAVVSRELTKMFEENRRAPLSELADRYDADGAPKGEIVILVAPPPEPEAAGEADIDAALHEALETMTLKDAARTVSNALDLPRKTVYDRALALKSDARSADG